MSNRRPDEALMDFARAANLIRAAGLDGLILFQPEHVAQAAGISPGVASLFRRAGAASVLVPADPAQAPSAVLPDLAEAIAHRSSIADLAFHPTWVDTAAARPHHPDTPLAEVLVPSTTSPRPSTFESSVAFGLLAAQLREKGLDDAILGADLGFVPQADYALLQSRLPKARIVDATDVVRRIRMVKTPAEIERLRTAAQLGEAGFEAALEAIRPGVTGDILGRAYTDGVRVAAARRHVISPGTWDYVSIGPQPWGAGQPAEAGSIIKFDLGVVIGGYSSDFARTVCMEEPSRAARELHAALLGALEAGIGMLGPGTRLADIHRTMLAAAREGGIAGYVRGHFGHGLGNDPFSEQWPFIAADSDVVAEPGLVLAVEAPHYVDGLGGFIIEDQVLVTETGCELMTFSPRGLTRFQG